MELPSRQLRHTFAHTFNGRLAYSSPNKGLRKPVAANVPLLHTHKALKHAPCRQGVSPSHRSIA